MSGDYEVTNPHSRLFFRGWKSQVMDFYITDIILRNVKWTLYRARSNSNLLTQLYCYYKII